MIYRLTFLSGPAIGQRVTVEKQPMSIGRGPACSIVLQDEEAAVKHAVLVHEGDSLLIRDLGTMNRLLVNQHEVREARLRHGDEVEIGRTRLLVQAVVQAEVEQPAGWGHRRRRRLLLVLLLVSAAAFAVSRARSRPEPEAVSASEPAPAPTASVARIEWPPLMPASPPAPPAPATSPAPSSNEILQMRADIVSLRHLVTQLQNRSEAPAPVPSPPRPADSRGSASARVPAAVRTPTPPPAPASAAPVAARPAADVRPGIRIVSVESSRFPANDEFDEMRSLEVTLARSSSGGDIATGDVRAEILFFDEDPAGARVALTRALTPAPMWASPGTWRPGETKTLTASYMVPKGSRGGEKAGAAWRYHGYRLQVYCRDRLEAVDARPQSLLPKQSQAEGRSGG